MNITSREIIQLRTHFEIGDLFIIDHNNASNYFKVKIKRTDQKPTNINLKFLLQITASRAKENLNSKYLTICYKMIDEDYLEQTDYEQKKHKQLIDYNSEFIHALNILADEFDFHAKLLQDGQTIYSFRQTHLKNKNQQGLHKSSTGSSASLLLDTPLYRVRLPVDVKTNRIGKRYRNDVSNIIVDLDNREPRSYTPMEASKLITYNSSTSGVITFDSICRTEKTISFMQNIKELLVRRHKPKKQDNFSSDEINIMS